MNVTGGIGTFSHTGTSKVTFLATTPGAGSLDAAITGSCEKIWKTNNLLSHD
jgi:hypothetical protein